VKDNIFATDKLIYKMGKESYFGEFGGRYVSPILNSVLDEIDTEFRKDIIDPGFKMEFRDIMRNYVGRPTPLLFAENITNDLGGAKIYLKLECLANTGAHKINNAVGQALLAKRLGRKHIIAETGAGQHGIATASICAKLGLRCDIYMGACDVARQKPNVFWMKTLGAKVIPVHDGTQTLTDAVDKAFSVWEKAPRDIYYLIGSALGPSPYPDMVRTFQSVIGKEVRDQIMSAERRLPDVMIACVGGGSNSIGFFNEFLNDRQVKLIGVEAGGTGDAIGQNANRMSAGSNASVAAIQGYKSMFIQKDNHLLPTHSICAGLDYAGIGPQLAFLGRKGRMRFTKALDDEVLAAAKYLSRREGIIPALESSHALVEAFKLAPKMSREDIIIVNISGRGDKDLFIMAKEIDKEDWTKFLDEEIVRLKRNI
jgi:tryptophan synthase beta chain